MNVIIRENDEDLDNYECFWSENRLFWYSFHHLSRTKSKLDKFQSRVKSRESRWKENSFNNLHFKENEIKIWVNQEKRKRLSKAFNKWIEEEYDYSKLREEMIDEYNDQNKRDDEYLL